MALHVVISAPLHFITHSYLINVRPVTHLVENVLDQHQTSVLLVVLENICKFQMLQPRLLKLELVRQNFQQLAQHMQSMSLTIPRKSLILRGLKDRWEFRDQEGLMTCLLT